jgi:P27 family predicted phage terminase small subunit
MNDLNLIQSTLIKFLKDKELYEDIDSTLLKELIFNIKISDECKENIEREGIRVLPSDKRYKKQFMPNKSLAIYQDAFKNINLILTNLGLTVKERQKLKLALADPDNFDKIMNL